MYILLGLIFLLLGGLMLIKPSLFYELTESWKSSADGEPSKVYILSTRIGGAVFTLVGIASIVVFFL